MYLFKLCQAENERFGLNCHKKRKPVKTKNLKFRRCQAEKLHERKDAQRKPLMPHLTGSWC